MVLTCFLLPQIHQAQEDKPSPTQNVAVPKRHIAFTEPGISKEPPVRLTRAPTPYPKDFQRFQRSLNNQLRKNRDDLNVVAHTVESKLTVVNPNDVYATTACDDAQRNHRCVRIDLDTQYAYANNSDVDNYCSNYSIDSSDQSKASLELQESCTIVQGPKEPPPYHIAAAYSKNAKFFNRTIDDPVEKPKNFTKEISAIPQNVSVPQPVHVAKQKGKVDEHFLKELNQRLLNTSDQKNDRKAKDDLFNLYYTAAGYGCEANSNDISNSQRVPKLIRVSLDPCSYVLGFTVTYNENVSIKTDSLSILSFPLLTISSAVSGSFRE